MNKKTIEYYDNNANQYADSTLGLDLGEQYINFTKDIPKGGKILDAGCGSGRDLIAFNKLGFNVLGIDASYELTKIAAKNSGLQVENKGFLEINYKNEFNGIWCMASLLHLNRNELELALIKISDALKEDGKFYASFKNGKGESYDDKGRFFNYLDKSELENIFKKIDRFKNLKISPSVDKLGRENTEWLNVYADNQKPEIQLKKKSKMKP